LRRRANPEPDSLTNLLLVNIFRRHLETKPLASTQPYTTKQQLLLAPSTQLTHSTSLLTTLVTTNHHDINQTTYHVPRIHAPRDSVLRLQIQSHEHAEPNHRNKPLRSALSTACALLMKPKCGANSRPALETRSASTNSARAPTAGPQHTTRANSWHSHGRQLHRLRLAIA
ncbi:hypothetical protein M758_9G172200, partial [Ceratodon purpureus]